MRPVLCLAAVLGLAACAPSFQTSSGARYLAASSGADPALRAAAAHEPHLSFPARIGVVRFVYGDVAALPERERAVLAAEVQTSLGPVVLLGPLEAQMAGLGRGARGLADWQRLAASRHLDYLLLLAYEPGHNRAEALFVGVRDGYPYASVEVHPEGRGRRGFWGGRVRHQGRLDAATLRLAKDLAPELEAMFAGLSARAAR